MQNSEIDPTKRFSNRVANYIKYRPKYPQAVIEFLVTKLNLIPSDIIADIGSGTGIAGSVSGCRAHASALDQPSVAHRIRHCRACRRHWRKHGGLQRCQRTVAALAAIPRTKPAGGAVSSRIYSTPQQRETVSRLA